MFLLMKRHSLSEEAQLRAGKEAPQPGDELAAEDAVVDSCALSPSRTRNPRLDNREIPASGAPLLYRTYLADMQACSQHYDAEVLVIA